MSDFVRELEGELISAAHRRARHARKLGVPARRTLRHVLRRAGGPPWVVMIRPPALLTAALVAAALMVTALLPRPSSEDFSGAVATVGSCSFPDATLLLRDEPCTSNPFGQ
jgi:hypothetical protein